MKRKQLFGPLALIGVCFVGTTPANAAAISFSEDPNGSATITVTTDITSPTPVITTSIESASLSLGTVAGPSTLLFRRQMINMGTMTGEGGGGGVSDVLELDSFLSAAGATVGFRATFQSDGETGISPPPGNFPATVTNLLENGNLQVLTPANLSVTLPGGAEPVALTVSARSDADEGTPGVSEPSTLALLSAGLLGFGMIRRRRTRT
jgi:hypothetical protein